VIRTRASAYVAPEGTAERGEVTEAGDDGARGDTACFGIGAGVK
jgi:hypothetical protein